ncbi:MAG TPA: PRC-barrel domain-containing protein [Candidatus Aquicultor sp.]|jgi:sporulation protein YlmC with PRC-barrel domain
MSFKRFSYIEAEMRVAPQIADLRGYQAFDSAGKFIGTVDDLLVDASDNTMADYILVSGGNIATMFSGKKLIVPLGRMNIDASNKTVHVNVLLDQLWDFPTYDSLDDPDLKDEVEEFWKASETHVLVEDVTLSYPAAMESPPPEPPEVESSKQPAHNPLIAAGLEFPLPESIVNRAVAHIDEELKAEEEPGAERSKQENEGKPGGQAA